MSKKIAINYANELYRNAQKLNTKSAYKNGADLVIEYNENSIDSDFYNEHIDVLSTSRGNGLWLWKPYIILDALNIAEDGDYIIYSDSGAAFVNKIEYLINSMNRQNTNVMCFAINQIEKKWSKRDALIILDCDKEEYLNSNQICATYIIVKKCHQVEELIKQYLRFCCDVRIISDKASELGDEYEDFKENRHDQTVWSLLCKKNNIFPFRDPSEYGNMEYSSYFDLEVLDRSLYPQIIESHRKSYFRYMCQLDYYSNRIWYRLLRKVVKIKMICLK